MRFGAVDMPGWAARLAAAARAGPMDQLIVGEIQTDSRDTEFDSIRDQDLDDGCFQEYDSRDSGSSRNSKDSGKPGKCGFC